MWTSQQVFIACLTFVLPCAKVVGMPKKKLEVPPRSGKQRKQGLLDFSHACSHLLHLSLLIDSLHHLFSLSLHPLCFFERASFFIFIFFFFFCSAMQHVGSYFPNQGLNPHSLHRKHGVLTPGKSLLSEKGAQHKWGECLNSNCYWWEWLYNKADSPVHEGWVVSVPWMNNHLFNDRRREPRHPECWFWKLSDNRILVLGPPPPSIWRPLRLREPDVTLSIKAFLKIINIHIPQQLLYYYLLSPSWAIWEAFFGSKAWIHLTS